MSSWIPFRELFTTSPFSSLELLLGTSSFQHSEQSMDHKWSQERDIYEDSRMLKLTIEESLTGPLAHPPTRRAVEELVERSNTLEEAAAGIDAIPGLTFYRGSMHVAIHTKSSGQFNPIRWAIITEGRG
jgi:hypothetical protein